ncbi:MAG: hypothetical protein JNM76_02775 [Betaproteobacteria bacterium]|nr:hypothetical protein [Betaproteobacteria bacterium]
MNPIRWMTQAGLGSMLLGWSCLVHGQATPNALPMRPKIAESGSVRAATPVLRESRGLSLVSRLGEQPPVLLPLSPERDAGIPGACSQAGDSLCYDYRQRRVVYKPARKLMPEIAGLQRESLSVKRDKVTLNYSFK